MILVGWSQLARRGGYTLLETLLTLAVLLAVAGAVYPAFQRFYLDLALRQAAQELQQEVGRLRASAVDSGLVHEFRYVPGEGRYLCGPTPTVEAASFHLPEGITFLEIASQATVSGAPASGESGWSTPTWFYPRGEADSAEFALVDAHERQIRVTIRDLTGVVSIGSVESAAKPGAD